MSDDNDRIINCDTCMDDIQKLLTAKGYRVDCCGISGMEDMRYGTIEISIEFYDELNIFRDIPMGFFLMAENYYNNNHKKLYKIEVIERIYLDKPKLAKAIYKEILDVYTALMDWAENLPPKK